MRSDSLLVRLNEKKDKGDRERQTTGAENPLGSSGVAKMMCEPVISRHAQSLKLWHLAWLSMIDIYLQIAVIHQCHIWVGSETTNWGAEQQVFHGLSFKDSYWTNPNQTPLLQSQSSIIPTNASLINERLLKVQQLWIQMDAKVLLMIMKNTFFSSNCTENFFLLPICFQIYEISGWLMV